MITLKDILTPELTLCHLADTTTKKQALQKISQRISEVDDRVKSADVLESLLKRERIGSTALGHGVAVPHARIATIKKPLCVLATLQAPVDFADDDTKQVDILFALLVPEKATDAHLDILSVITQALQSASYRTQLREAASDHELYTRATTAP